MKDGYTNYKTGAASFYIVAFSTLILMIVAASFASAIVAELERSSNDDLAQSAYDAAMAGVEDAKLAFADYRACLASGASGDSLSIGDAISCQDIIYWVTHPDGDRNYSGYSGCEMVGRVLGRIGKRTASDEDTSVVEVKEGDKDNGMEQAYTCAKILTQTNDYRATLDSLNPYKVVKASFSGGVKAKDIKKIKLSWWLKQDEVTENFSNSPTAAFKQANFISLNGANNNTPTPPVMALQLLQSVNKDNLSKVLSDRIERANVTQTNRATVYLVPTNREEVAQRNKGTFTDTSFMSRPIYENGRNELSVADVVKTNDHGKDAPFATYCDKNADTEFLCSVIINLPYPIGSDANGQRDDDTFAFVVYLPYETPDTDFSLEFYVNGNDNPVAIKDTQLVIDSTGRANSLYSRVEVRLEQEVDFYYPLYAVQAGSLEKNFKVDREYVSEDEYERYFGEIDKPLEVVGNGQIDF